MKRFTSIFLSLLVLISLITIPALAADVDHVGEVYPNLLDNFSHFTWYNDRYDYESQFPTVSYSGYETDYIRLNFTGNHNSFAVNQLYFDFTATQNLTIRDIAILYSSPSETLIITADFLSTVETDDGLLYYSYLFDIGDTIQGTFTIEFVFDLTSDFDINVLSLYSDYGSNCISYTGGDVLVQGTLQQGGEGFYNQPFFDDSVELPYTFNTSFENHAGPYNNMMEIYYRVNTTFVARADQVVITFISTGVYDNYYDHNQLSNGGITLISPNATFNIPVNAYYSLMDSSWEGMDVWRVSVVADLSGYDLSQSYLDFSTVFFPATPIPSNGGVSSYFFRIESCKFFLNPPVNGPWYRTLYTWISNSLWEFNSSINARFQYLEQHLNRLFGGNQAPPSVSDQQQAMDDVIGDMGDLSDDFENSQNEIEELMPSMPSWEDTGLGALPGQYGANITQILAIFHAIYENTIITQILTFTFLFALGGFILFGER